MPRLIDADALIAEYDRVHIGEAGKARKLIADAPTVDAVEVVHGRWEATRFGDLRIATCSACGGKQGLYINGRIPNYNFCPNCGAKMDGDGNG